MKIVPATEAASQIQAWHGAGIQTVAVSGSFDLLHAGHIRFLEQARTEGQKLIVLLNSDQSIRSYKGANRPIIPEADRAYMLGALEAVDLVVLFDELTPVRLLTMLQPRVFANGTDYGPDCIERAPVEAYGGVVRLIERVNMAESTSQIIERIAASTTVPSARAVLFDRDGTLIADTGYLHDPAQMVWMPGAFETLTRLQTAGYRIGVITNQSGIGRGMYGEAEMQAVHDRMQSEAAEAGITLFGFYFCPHHPDDGCTCRKPGIDLIRRAAEDQGLDLSKSWMIGDQCSDIEAGRASNMKTILVSNESTCTPGPHQYAHSLSEAADYILR